MNKVNNPRDKDNLYNFEKPQLEFSENIEVALISTKRNHYKKMKDQKKELSKL